MPVSRRARRRRRSRADSPLFRVLAAAAGVVLIVLLCMGVTAMMPKQPPETAVSAGDSALSAQDEQTPEPTAEPSPGATDTPPVFAPFGAQYGYGGADLIPATPTPDPALATEAPRATDAPTPQPTPSGYTTLRRGSTGQAVVRLQQALIDLGYLSGAADGDYGANTTNAVVSFQAVNGLSADGIAGQQTQTLLFSGNALSADEAPEMDYLVLVNRERMVDKNYVPSDLVSIADVVPNSVLKVKYKGTRANRTAVEALSRMLQVAIAEGVDNWQVSSAYRTYADQQRLVDDSVASFRQKNPSWSRERCLSATYQTVAPAGSSEHQTGLAFDITVPGVSFNGTAQQKWLHKHCHEYGFVIRFTEEKQAITGFLAEAWHIRYVGIDAAQVMTRQNWCLEEYANAMGL